jgi:hypothetical protein
MGWEKFAEFRMLEAGERRSIDDAMKPMSVGMFTDIGGLRTVQLAGAWGGLQAGVTETVGIRRGTIDHYVRMYKKVDSLVPDVGGLFTEIQDLICRGRGDFARIQTADICLTPEIENLRPGNASRPKKRPIIFGSVEGTAECWCHVEGPEAGALPEVGSRNDLPHDRPGLGDVEEMIVAVTSKLKEAMWMPRERAGRDAQLFAECRKTYSCQDQWEIAPEVRGIGRWCRSEHDRIAVVVDGREMERYDEPPG